jgi:5-methyltetrahydrofolate--homocysteine methyltransferase
VRRAGQGIRAQHDDYNAIIVKALADRLARRSRNTCTRRLDATGATARAKNWGRRISSRRSIAASGRLRLPGVPGSHGEGLLFRLLHAPEIGIELTESFAMPPAAA